MIHSWREESGRAVHELIMRDDRSQFQGLSRYQGAIEGPWDEIAIRYVLIAHHIAKRRPTEAFKEHTVFIKFVSTTFPVPSANP